MSELFKTYAVFSDLSLHDLFSTKGVPTNKSLMDVKLVRGDEKALAGLNVREIVFHLDNALAGDTFKLAAQVCFTRHKSRKELGKVKFKAISKADALDLFCKKAGLVRVGGSSCDVSAVIDDDLTIHGFKDLNTFIITGTFKVSDFERFKNAYNYGVGRRKSYGCGLILVL
jgi:hypothetical protein